MTLRKATIFCSVLFVAINGFGQTFKSITYTDDNSNFPNPERGFYHHTEVNASNYNFLDLEELVSYREEGITLIIRVFYLDKFVNSVLSPTYLENVRQDFITARRAGVKIIVRFAYIKKSTAPYGDAMPGRVIQHIAQLGPILRENSDVIATIQAGFVGAWGEWYYTDYFSKTLGNPTADDWLSRQQVVDAMLEQFPSDRSIQVRTPDIKRKLVENRNALTAAEAFKNTRIARIGHHNDCFLASPDDYGTYIDQDDEKPYLEEETKYTPMGGETCGPYVPLSECPNAIAQMQRFHWSYLNRDYHPDVIDSWSNMCLEDVEKKLGYRLKLTGASLQEASKPGGEVKFNLTLANEGWASPFNKRNVEIVLRNKSTGKEYRLSTTNDPRTWLPASSIPVSIVGGLPAGIEEGEYSVYLNLSSPEISIAKNSKYSIRLANGDVWESSTGYNDLHHTLVVNASATAPTYSGPNFFLSSDVLPETLPAPSPMIQSVFGNNVLLYWGSTEGDEYRVLQRAVNGTGVNDFQTIAILPPGTFTYVDKDLLNQSTYAYRAFASNGVAVSPLTPVVQNIAEGTVPPYYVHRTDGDIDDWASVKPVETLYKDGQTFALRLFQDRDSIYYHIKGNFSSYELTLQNFSNFTWNSSASTFTKRVDDNLEGSVSMDDFAGAGNTLLFITLKVDGEVMFPKTGQLSFIRVRPPQVLQNFNVEVSGPHLLIVSWKTCSDCNGYVVERSASPNSAFEEVKRLNGPGTYIYYDATVVADQQYYYRAASYNETGLSEYTEVVSATPVDPVTGIESSNETVVAYPNPVNDVLTVRWRKGDRTLMIYDALGRSISPKLLNESKEARAYDVSRLSSGLYFVRISGDHGVTSISIKK